MDVVEAVQDYATPLVLAGVLVVVHVLVIAGLLVPINVPIHVQKDALAVVMEALDAADVI